MTKELEVRIFNHSVGYLRQDISGDLSFTYSEAWLAHENCFPISISLPLQKNKFGQRACRPFFGGVLPEAKSREIIAKNLGISQYNDFSLLKEIGLECSGAVSLVDASHPLEQALPSYREISLSEMKKLLTTIRLRPLLAGEEGVRMSLAGAQPKLSLYKDADKFFLPLNGAAGTHIIKPEILDLPGSASNENFCLHLANAAGLTAAKSMLSSLDSNEFTQVERYDRLVVTGSDSKISVKRYHQEDFCQALGIPSDNKYQAEGGPSIVSCLDLIRKRSASPGEDSLRFLDAVILNFFIGNCDAHGKNFSLIYSEDMKSLQLAPLYDILCTRLYPALDKKLAMRIGSEYDSDKVMPNHFESLAVDAGISPKLLLNRVFRIGRRVSRQARRLSGLHRETAEFVMARTDDLLAKYARAESMKQ